MKNRFNVIVVAAFVIAILTLPCIFNAETLPDYDLITHAAKVPESSRPTVSTYHSGLRQHTVLWDTTHGMYLNYYPYGNYSELTALLADSGFTMELCSTGVHNLDLSLYDVIVINVASNWWSPYTAEEVDSLVSYYDQGCQRVILVGDASFCSNSYLYTSDNYPFADNIFDWIATSGGILIMGDDAGCNNVNINPVANAFHMTAGLTNITPTDLYISNFAAHPIFDNVSQIYFRAAGEISATTPAEVIAWTSIDEPVVGVLDETIGIENEYQTAFPVMKVTPNPFRYQTEIKGIAGMTTVRIFDVSGQFVEESNSNIIGNNLEGGVYFIEVEGYKPVKIIKL